MDFKDAQQRLREPLRVHWAPGERVRVIDGPFGGMTGVIDSVSGDRATVSIDIFGKPTLLELPFNTLACPDGSKEERMEDWRPIAVGVLVMLLSIALSGGPFGAARELRRAFAGQDVPVSMGLYLGLLVWVGALGVFWFSAKRGPRRVTVVGLTFLALIALATIAAFVSPSRYPDPDPDPTGQPNWYGLVGCFYEFHLKTFSSATIRIVARGSNGDWGGPDDPVVDEGLHVRGSWPFQMVEFSKGAHPPFNFSVADGTATQQFELCPQVTEGQPPSVESIAFAKRADDPHGNTKGNPACYGANVRYRLQCTSGVNGGALWVFLRSRTTPSRYAGCVNVWSPLILDRRDVPKFGCAFASDPPAPGDSYRNLFNLFEDYGVGCYGSEPQRHFPLQIYFAHACGAGLPINLVLSRLNEAVS